MGGSEGGCLESLDLRGSNGPRVNGFEGEVSGIPLFQRKAGKRTITLKAEQMVRES